MAIPFQQVALILLAAGRSRRFGGEDKLLHPLHGEPLALHAARTLAALPFGAHIAVAGPEVAAILPPVFRGLANPDPDRGLSSLIAIGVAAVERPQRACLIALADMPLVPASHFESLLRAFDAADSQAMLATCSAGGRAMVPALFGEGRFAALGRLAGDQGARDLLAGAPTIACEAALLRDLDRPGDFSD